MELVRPMRKQDQAKKSTFGSAWHVDRVWCRGTGRRRALVDYLAQWVIMRRPHFVYGHIDSLLDLIMIRCLSQLRAIWRQSLNLTRDCQVQLCERRELLSILRGKIGTGVF